MSTPVPSTNIERLEHALRQMIASLPGAAIALSGGVDSSVVAALAVAELGSRALAVTGASASLAPEELTAIRALCAARGLAHVVVETHELASPAYVENTPERCYHCKSELYQRIATVAATRGLAVLLDGTTADDLHAHRPGRRAAAEHHVRSPLLEVHATKSDVRALARRLGLANAERPASPCLSSRVAYGLPITAERLTRIGRAEAVLHELGFANVRVRLHDTLARVEVSQGELGRAVAAAASITEALRRLGFVYVTLDLAGLRSGSLLEVFSERPS